MARVVVICGFVSGPAIIFSGYAIYSLHNWLVVTYGMKIPDPIYLIILFLVMWSAMWLTAGKLIHEIREQTMKDQAEALKNDRSDNNSEDGN